MKIPCLPGAAVIFIRGKQISAYALQSVIREPPDIAYSVGSKPRLVAVLFACDLAALVVFAGRARAQSLDPNSLIVPLAAAQVAGIAIFR